MASATTLEFPARLSRTAVARRLNVSPHIVGKLIERGDLREIDIPGREMITVRSVERYIVRVCGEHENRAE